MQNKENATLETQVNETKRKVNYLTLNLKRVTYFESSKLMMCQISQTQIFSLPPLLKNIYFDPINVARTGSTYFIQSKDLVGTPSWTSSFCLSSHAYNIISFQKTLKLIAWVGFSFRGAEKNAYAWSRSW
ncbi:hypothetical protein F2P56_004758 [Juglans regia]|uniref:Uncharacterized protein n=1 Tax=Juglans regia TaxID=51240 RepID=A0A833Y8Q4_JUGRE|nr:hypothetical protein F2P56_004758 [Juglans regia]